MGICGVWGLRVWGFVGFGGSGSGDLWGLAQAGVAGNAPLLRQAALHPLVFGETTLGLLGTAWPGTGSTWSTSGHIWGTGTRAAPHISPLPAEPPFPSLFWYPNPAEGGAARIPPRSPQPLPVPAPKLGCPCSQTGISLLPNWDSSAPKLGCPCSQTGMSLLPNWDVPSPGRAWHGCSSPGRAVGTRNSPGEQRRAPQTPQTPKPLSPQTPQPLTPLSRAQPGQDQCSQSFAAAPGGFSLSRHFGDKSIPAKLCPPAWQGAGRARSPSAVPWAWLSWRISSLWMWLGILELGLAPGTQDRDWHQDWHPGLALGSGLQLPVGLFPPAAGSDSFSDPWKMLGGRENAASPELPGATRALSQTSLQTSALFEVCPSLLWSLPGISSPNCSLIDSRGWGRAGTAPSPQWRIRGRVFLGSPCSLFPWSLLVPFFRDSSWFPLFLVLPDSLFPWSLLVPSFLGSFFSFSHLVHFSLVPPDSFFSWSLPIPFFPGPSWFPLFPFPSFPGPTWFPIFLFPSFPGPSSFPLFPFPSFPGPSWFPIFLFPSFPGPSCFPLFPFPSFPGPSSFPLFPFPSFPGPSCSWSRAELSQCHLSPHGGISSGPELPCPGLLWELSRQDRDTAPSGARGEEFQGIPRGAGPGSGQEPSLIRLCSVFLLVFPIPTP
ncbi:uncharacterized protein LOC120499113 [Passer montanus]|uniref:uncharacterized protein LOC120499113 n=1 Tax=Passer montanus TaxID=9160 RepID=UPI001961C204|nr:uncharacterized protein LOC120499113 [Passer montanus]